MKYINISVQEENKKGCFIHLLRSNGNQNYPISRNVSFFLYIWSNCYNWHFNYNFISEKHTRIQAAEQCPELGVAILVVVFKQVAPEDLDGGSSLLQDPGQEWVHGPVDSISGLFLQSVLLEYEKASEWSEHHILANVTLFQGHVKSLEISACLKNVLTFDCLKFAQRNVLRYLEQLLGDDVFVRQAVHKGEGVVHSHGDIRPQLPHQGPGTTVSKGFYSGHDLSLEPNWTCNDSVLPHCWMFQTEEACLSP